VAICRACNAETLRIVTTVTKNGEFVDQCPECSPETFVGEKVSDPSAKKMWMGWEVDPAHYKKTDDGYQASDSVLADLQAAVMRESEDDRAKINKALAARREYAAQHRHAETEIERITNDNAAREMVREAELKASLFASGVVLPESM
jgi:hypothetical protein